MNYCFMIILLRSEEPFKQFRVYFQAENGDEKNQSIISGLKNERPIKIHLTFYYRSVPKRYLQPGNSSGSSITFHFSSSDNGQNFHICLSQSDCIDRELLSK